jgi:hypothetical protein
MELRDQQPSDPEEPDSAPAPDPDPATDEPPQADGLDLLTIGLAVFFVSLIAIVGAMLVLTVLV